jgi:predicted dehydrogenase
MDRKVRIGFVGVGMMGQCAHLRNYAALESCEVVALAELRTETGKLVAERYGVPKVYTSHEDMLAAESLDAVVASQPFDTHAVLLPSVYGKVPFVFTEKPLAVTPEAGRKLADLAEQTGTVHMVGYHKRSDPATMYAKQVIDEWKASGEMGALRYVRILMPPGDWIAGGFNGLLNAGDKGTELGREPAPDMEGAEGGTWSWTGKAGRYVSFVNYYIHQVNLMRYLLGEPYRVRYADKSGVLMVVESESGVTGNIEMSPYRTTIEWEESALIAFEKGYIKLSLPAPLAFNRPGAVEVYRDPGEGAVPERMTPTLPWVHAMRQQAVHFIKVCRGEMKPLCEPREAVQDLEMALDYIDLVVKGGA